MKKIFILLLFPLSVLAECRDKIQAELESHFYWFVFYSMVIGIAIIAYAIISRRSDNESNDHYQNQNDSNDSNTDWHNHG